MEEKKTFFGVNKKCVERHDSLDESWYVEIWQIKYFFFGIEIYCHKKEFVKRARVDSKCSL